ncbi:rhodanese-like domain-containing protein [Phytoactinopolyspora limicola]|uniref:rhodanese-like domain-containing protein n=1 Tax=Phytoactinopolyspora limicola TaxID=2715536 RepID=UPI001A9C9CE2|nr:rhodanese-like domain-containing protein [Phytoactinopolyspora limicola]
MNHEPTGIAVAGLVERYGRVTAVDDLSFTAGPGEVTGFLGPNGAGRRRLCASCSRWLPPTLAPPPSMVRPTGTCLDRPISSVRRLTSRLFHPARTGRNHLRVLCTVNDEELTHDELLARASNGDVVVLDVRPREEYNFAHIPGAVSIPVDELAQRLQDLPDGQEIVAYCRGAYCVLAYDAVELLRAQGRRARRLQDGMLEWRLAGRPIQHRGAA